MLGTDATAVFAGSDNIALGLLKRLYERGLRVPRDYSVVSYDNSAADVLFEPALTSIEQNVDELAAAALDVMFRRVEGGRAGRARGPHPHAAPGHQEQRARDREGEKIERPESI